jgi:hypothetical protein
MATQAQMDRLVGRALFSDEFRKLLIEDPEKAARRLRYRLDASQLARIRGLSEEELEELARKFSKAIEPPYRPLSFW